MNETTIKQELIKALERQLPYAVAFRHEDLYTAGIPDISVSGQYNRTAWLEVKFGRVKLRGLQHRKLQRLGGFYVVYNMKREVYIVDPHEGKEKVLAGTAAKLVSGHGHLVVIEFVHNILTGDVV